MRRAAVIAIGSNSTRMLTADLDGELSRPLRGRRETRLFLSLSDTHALSPEAVLRVRNAVRELQGLALGAGAERVDLIATSAVRDASDVLPLNDGLLKDTGLKLQIISGRQEAAYSFLGAVYPYGDGELLGVADIGGGSTEIAVGTREVLRVTRSLQLGASRLYAVSPIDDFASLVPALAQAERVMDSAWRDIQLTPSRWLLVGGTGTALIGLLRGQAMLPDAGADEAFTREELLVTLRRLARLTPAERAALPGMTPGREHILPTGLAVLAALMTRLDMEEMSVTARNNTDGYLYALSRKQGEAAPLNA